MNTMNTKMKIMNNTVKIYKLPNQHIIIFATKICYYQRNCWQIPKIGNLCTYFYDLCPLKEIKYRNAKISTGF